MRLFEVEDRFTNDLITILRNQLGRADSKDETQTLTYEALSEMLANLGYGEMDKDSFQRVNDDNPGVQALVASIGEDGVTLSTEKKPEEPESKLDFPIDGGPSVDSMASQAAKKHLNDVSR